MTVGEACRKENIARIKETLKLDILLNHLIKTDSYEQFIEYISNSGIAKKFKHQSKTIEKLIDWMIEYRSIKIINTIIDGKIIGDQHKYKIILLTQEFNLLGKNFILYLYYFPLGHLLKCCCEL